MCGIVGAVSERNITNILVECLKRLEYRGYDSAGIAVLDKKNFLHTVRAVGKIEALEKKLKNFTKELGGNVGIAHTRWATHGGVTIANAHPHVSDNTIAVIHNGIIENYEILRDDLLKDGFKFSSDTDTEVIAHLIYKYFKQKNDLLAATSKAIKQLKGAYALAIINAAEPNKIIAVRYGSPVVLGIGIGENFIASDPIALLPVTSNFIYLEEGDIAVVERNKVSICDSRMRPVKRKTRIFESSADSIERGRYRHFMQKEIFEQPEAITNTLEARIGHNKIPVEIFGNHAKDIFTKVKRVKIVGCGSAFHAALVGKYWIEQYANVLCSVEIASEFRYRKSVVENDTLFIVISQSGETADTLAALRLAKKLPFITTLAICNTPESSIVRESNLVFMTRAGTEIGVASTKCFTTQLVTLLMLTITLGINNGQLKKQTADKLIKQLICLPTMIEKVLALDDQINVISKMLEHSEHVFFLGRGINFPVALEGALKMKEISYIHAESYPAGELKHGPLALIDHGTYVVAIAPNDHLFEKLNSNLHEVKARGGKLIIFADESLHLKDQEDSIICNVPTMPEEVSPIVYTVVLQLLAYHVAVGKGTDVDRPRNLAKSVTVE